MALYGLSKDTVAAQKKFKEKFDLPYPLIADPEQKLLNALGVIKDKTMYGRKVKGTVRTTLLIGADGKVEKVWDSVKCDVHAKEVLDSI